MIRKIIKIDEDMCNGCGLCIDACYEGAIGMKGEKAVLLRDDYCDGLGDCLPVCPKGAITFEEREADAYNYEEVHQNMAGKVHKQPLSCPGSNLKIIKREASPKHADEDSTINFSHLNQWPVQIKLVPINSPYFEEANLLIAADCTAYAYGNFHNRFMKNKITLIGCPKLDDGDYAEKFAVIIKENNIKSITVARMEVPCCAGIEHAVIKALKLSDKIIPLQVITISTEGIIIE